METLRRTPRYTNAHYYDYNYNNTSKILTGILRFPEPIVTVGSACLNPFLKSLSPVPSFPCVHIYIHIRSPLASTLPTSSLFLSFSLSLSSLSSFPFQSSSCFAAKRWSRRCAGQPTTARLAYSPPRPFPPREWSATVRSAT